MNASKCDCQNVNTEVIPAFCIFKTVLNMIILQDQLNLSDQPERKGE